VKYNRVSRMILRPAAKTVIRGPHYHHHHPRYLCSLTAAHDKIGCTALRRSSCHTISIVRRFCSPHTKEPQPAIKTEAAPTTVPSNNGFQGFKRKKQPIEPTQTKEAAITPIQVTTPRGSAGEEQTTANNLHESTLSKTDYKGSQKRVEVFRYPTEAELQAETDDNMHMLQSYSPSGRGAHSEVGI
jgi:hypothetical protein